MCSSLLVIILGLLYSRLFKYSNSPWCQLKENGQSLVEKQEKRILWVGSIIKQTTPTSKVFTRRSGHMALENQVTWVVKLHSSLRQFYESHVLTLSHKLRTYTKFLDVQSKSITWAVLPPYTQTIKTNSVTIQDEYPQQH